jgi:uncharacterized phage infection (PIP) family protein YhgE
MNFVDFGALPRYSDAYLPSPVRKSVGIRKMQEKFGNSGLDVDDKPVTRNFRSYRDIEKPPFEVLESPTKKSGASSNEAPQSPSGKKDYRSLDSPRSIMFPMDSPVPTATYKSAVPSSPVRSTFDAKAAIPRPPVLGGIMDAPKSPKSPSKKQAVKKTVSFDKAATPKAAGGRSYPCWDYGKKKTFARPPSNLRTNRAATTIQRLVRGGMQRLHYRVAKLERMLDTRDQRTTDAKAKVRQEFEQRKVTLRLKLEQESKKETRKQQQIRTTAEEAQKLVAYLRRENKKLREKNQEIHLAIVDLNEQNKRLETANSVTDGTIGTLNDHTKTIEDTHAKLMEVIPKYQETIGTLNDAVQLRRQYGNAEHKIRLLYVKLMGDIVEHLEGSTTEFALAEEAMQSILRLEEEELAKDRPVNPDEYLGASSATLRGMDASDGIDDDDDDDLNNYRVHTMD